MREKGGKRCCFPLGHLISPLSFLNVGGQCVCSLWSPPLPFSLFPHNQSRVTWTNSLERVQFACRYPFYHFCPLLLMFGKKKCSLKSSEQKSSEHRRVPSTGPPTLQQAGPILKSKGELL